MNGKHIKRLPNYYRVLKYKVKGENPIIIETPLGIKVLVSIERQEKEKFLKISFGGDIILFAPLKNIDYFILDPNLKEWSNEN